MPNTGSSSEALKVLADRLSRALADLPPLDAIILFDLGEDGQLRVDARHTPASVSAGSGSAACTLSMRLDTLERMLKGELDGTTAFMQGEMTITGDVELAVRLNELLAHAPAGTAGGASRN